MKLTQQSGFTLIELVMVIVILGILAATALPKFIDLSGNAQQAATDGMAGALGAASAVNKTSRTVAASNGVSVSNCTHLSGALDGGLPSGYTITSTAVSTSAGTATCTITGPGSKTSNFVAHGIA